MIFLPQKKVIGTKIKDTYQNKTDLYRIFGKDVIFIGFIIYNRCTRYHHQEYFRWWRRSGALQVVLAGILNGMLSLSTIDRPDVTQREIRNKKVRNIIPFGQREMIRKKKVLQNESPGQIFLQSNDHKYFGSIIDHLDFLTKWIPGKLIKTYRQGIQRDG